MLTIDEFEFSLGGSSTMLPADELFVDAAPRRSGYTAHLPEMPH
jgi:hypothetical protein